MRGEGAAPDDGFLLALLNSTPTVAGQATDLLAEPEQARAWITEHAPIGEDGQRGEERERGDDREDIVFLRRTRDVLQALVQGSAGPAALGPVLEGVGYRAEAGESGIAWTLVTPPGRALAVRAVLAWDTLARTAPGRLRPCQNTEECTLFLIDRSKSNSARWCSMAQCGNRMKARRHYERARGARSAG
jgi:predicted RNA-binding Zn ribbon-like protein